MSVFHLPSTGMHRRLPGRHHAGRILPPIASGTRNPSRRRQTGTFRRGLITSRLGARSVATSGAESFRGVVVSAVHGRGTLDRFHDHPFGPYMPAHGSRPAHWHSVSSNSMGISRLHPCATPYEVDTSSRRSYFLRAWDEDCDIFELRPAPPSAGVTPCLRPACSRF